ncbi:MAG: flagellar hook-associated protein 3 [Chromatiales bacterium 21-64-14]|nr:MAG: flagellar hook-associated protein 3 [Chromatiales bacterium 21-64-14]HQU15098.1 flagellar hook-associated protein FlgL [Gammaproteobacteria bacterium]
MRIATIDMFQQGTASILNQQTLLSQTQQQLATGQQLLSPSDNPAAAAQVQSLDVSISQTNQYQTNADAATASLNVENSALTSVVNGLQSARDLAVQGLNGTQSAQARQGIATQVQQILDQVVSVANTQDVNGKYIFAGYSSGSAPVSATGTTYTYTGDSGQRLAQIGPSRQVAVGDSGSAVFMNVPASGGGKQSVFKTLSDLIAGLQANNPSQSSLTNLDNALNNVLTVQTEIGSRLNAISDQKNLNTNFLTQVTTNRSQLADVNVAQASIQLNQQLLALQAAQQSFAKIQGLSLFNYLR